MAAWGVIQREGREFELVRGEGSVEAWTELVGALEKRRAAGEEMGAWVGALEPELLRWPEDVARLLPMAWTYRLAARGTLPEARLANALLLSDAWAMTRFKDFRPLTQRPEDEYDILGDEYDGVEADDRLEQERVFAAVELRSIRSLDISYISEDNPYSPGPMVWLMDAGPLLASPCLPGLRVLKASCALKSWKDAGRQLCEVLLRAPHLRVLDISHNELEAEDLEALAACSLVARLAKLVITGNDYSGKGRSALAKVVKVVDLDAEDDAFDDDES